MDFEKYCSLFQIGIHFGLVEEMKLSGEVSHYHSAHCVGFWMTFPKLVIAWHANASAVFKSSMPPSTTMSARKLEALASA